jgi:hypothetical protein
MGADRRRTVEIEALLRWTYCEELPKREISSSENIWDQIGEYGARGGVDVGHGAAQRYPHHGVPHPDALTVEQAVSALPDGTIDWQLDGRAIMGDLIALADPRPPAVPKSGRTTRVGWWRSGSRRNGSAHPGATSWITEAVPAPRQILLVRSLRTAALVVTHAKLGTRPDWHAEVPRAVPVVGERGRPKLVGEAHGKNRYSAGAYCPLRYEPSATSIAEERADYVAWWRGLSRLAKELELDEMRVEGPEAVEMPWGEPEPPSGAVLTSWPVTREALRVLPLKAQRPVARAPWRAYRNPSPVLSR